nr:MAG TPA: major capsid protein [Caudoviricetes sp.]
MKFKTVAEAFNHYRTMDVADMEKRAKEIDTIITTDASADIEALNIELRGIKEARENAELRNDMGQTLNLITGTKKEPKAKTFGADVLDTAEYRNAFYKSLLGQKLTPVETAAFEAAKAETEKRADAFSSSTDTAAVLPTATLNEIISKARTMGGLLAECRAFNVPTKIAIPVGTPATKAAWHTEGAAVETEKPTIASVTFDGYEILKIFSISAKVRTMSIAAFEAYLVQELTACVMECIADALVNGTGSGQGTGLESITWTDKTNAVKIATSASMTYADVVTLVGLLPRGYSQGAKFAMNNATLYNQFYGMVDANKRPIFVADPKTDNVGKILGFEVVIDDNIANNDVYFGNYAKYMGYNMPDGIVIETSRDSGFRKGLIDYRAMAIADCKPIVAEAFVKMYKATA